MTHRRLVSVIRSRSTLPFDHRVLFGVGAGLLMSCGGTPEPTASVSAALGAENAAVVISQVYGGGGNSLAPYRNDFVELFNRSQQSVTLSGWSLQYASATGTGNFSSNPLVALNATLAPGQYLLVQLAGGATGEALPPPDATGTTNLSATGGKVALVSSTTGLACNGGSTPCSAALEATLVDLVGYGSANFFEGAAATPAASNTSSVSRKGAGCADSNDNAADFVLTAPSPRSSATSVAPCTGGTAPSIAHTAPANGSTGVPANETLTVTFSEPVTLGDAWYALSCNVSGLVLATASGGPALYTITPDATFAAGEACTLGISAAAVADLDEGAHLPNDVAVSFVVAEQPTSIHAIQGASHLSPFAGRVVRTTGTVTAVRSNGYYVQEPSPDEDPATSEGLFVFTSSAPNVRVGDSVDVTGTVSEFRPGCSGSCSATSSAYSNLTTTELTTPTTRVLASDQPLPPPIVIGSGGRLPPEAIISDDASSNVESATHSFDPEVDGIDFYESLEAMRVQLNDAVAVGPTRLFGASREVSLVGDGGAHASLRTVRGGVVARASDFNPERLVLANELVPELPLVDVGDAFPGAILGVLDYNFANYRILATAPLPVVSAGNIARETHSLGAPTSADLDLAAFNVENLDPTDPAEKFADLAEIVVNNLRSPDLLALEEVQDQSGATNDGTVDASLTYQRLISAILDAGGPAYEFRSIDPQNNQDGGEPGGNIRVGFLFRTDRGLSFVDRPGATALTANAVVAGASEAALAYSPGRIDPTNPAFSSSRKPLAAEFTFNGATLFVIANHFNSKGGDQPLFGRFQPPLLGSQAQRVAQAEVVADFVTDILSADPNANVVVLGDLNDFEFSAPLSVLKEAGLSPLIETLPPNERYTYVYEGNSQALDHVLVSSHALARTSGYDVVHVNSEFATQASDHDPSVARLTLDAIAPVLAGPGNVTVEATGPGGARVTFDVTASDEQYGDLPVTCSPSSGSSFALGTTEVFCHATDPGGNTGTTSFVVTVQDTTPPALSDSPSSVEAFATRRDGARVSYQSPTAFDLVDGGLPVTCLPASGSLFGLGQTTVTCSATDDTGHQSTSQFVVAVTVSAPPGPALFLPPIESDGSSVFHLGRTIPVKFALTGVSTAITNLNAKLYVTKLGSGVPVTSVETFRYDPRTRKYVLDLSTSRLRPGTWQLRADLGDGTPHAVTIRLRR